MDDRLKNLRKAMDDTVFKDGHFSEKSKAEVRQRISQKKKKGNFIIMKMPIVVTALLCVFFIGGAYMILNNQPFNMESANYDSNSGGYNNSNDSDTAENGDGTAGENYDAGEDSAEENGEFDNRDESDGDTNAPPGEKENDGAPDQDTVPVTTLRLIDQNSGWVGGKGWIARTENQGENWNIQWSNPSYTVEQIFALNGDLAWAVLDDETVNDEPKILLRSQDGGLNWTQIGKVPVSEDTFSNSSSVGFLHFTSSVEGFAGKYTTRDGGETWSELPTPENTINHTYFHDRENGWAATYDHDNNVISVKKSEDGGENWETIMERETTAPLTKVDIRSAGPSDAWILMTGDAGMSQVGYSLFHTEDDGETLRPVLVNSTAGAGPGPGFTIDDDDDENYPAVGSEPGELFVLNENVAFMTGICAPCEDPISMGVTTDGGETWNISEGEYIGYHAKPNVGFADDKNGWWITGDGSGSSILYITNDGGNSWKEGFHFSELAID